MPPTISLRLTCWLKDCDTIAQWWWHHQAVGISFRSRDRETDQRKTCSRTLDWSSNMTMTQSTLSLRSSLETLSYSGPNTVQTWPLLNMGPLMVPMQTETDLQRRKFSNLKASINDCFIKLKELKTGPAPKRASTHNKEKISVLIKNTVGFCFSPPEISRIVSNFVWFCPRSASTPPSPLKQGKNLDGKMFWGGACKSLCAPHHHHHTQHMLSALSFY